MAIRKNLMVFSATFVAADGDDALQPSSANAVLSYPTAEGPASATVSLTYNADDNLWTGEWDSSAATQGTVQWMVYGTGSLQAATEGRFEIVANAANTV